MPSVQPLTVSPPEPRGEQAEPTHPNGWTSFWAAVVRYETEKITPWLALRNTVGVLLPLAAGALLGAVPVGIALATGAMNVSYSDSHEPYRLRSRKMLAASVLVALAVFTGALCGGNNVVAVLLAAAWACAAGIVVAMSTTAADLGSISLVTLIVYSAVPQTPERAVYAGLLALLGGLFQTLLSVALWPVRRYVPERRELGKLFLELSQMASSTVEVLQAPPASGRFTRAQSTLAGLDRDRSLEAQRYRMLWSEAERMRLCLLMLGRLRIRIGREKVQLQADPLDRYLGEFSRVLLALSVALAAGERLQIAAASLETFEKLAAAMRDREADLEPFTALIMEARFQMDALNGQLRSAIELASNAMPGGLENFEQVEAARPWKLRLEGALATLRASLSLQSTAFRHAVRLAVCVAIGDGLARGFGVRRPYWIPMTIAIVLKPDFQATFSRGVLRLAGTMAGLVLATALFHLLHPSMGAEILLIGAFMFAVRSFGPANYGLFVTMVTGLVVVLIALTGVAPKDVMLARGVNTIAGGVIALMAYWLWPTWERTQVPEALAHMLDAYRHYFRAVRESYLDQNIVLEAALDRARRESRRTRSNLEASIERMRAEPGLTPQSLRSWSGIQASSNRLIHAVMALEAGLASSEPAPARSGFRPFANDVELTLYYLSSALRGSLVQHQTLPDLREDHYRLIHSAAPATERYALVNVETDRITNSLNTLSEEVLRWLGRAPEARS